MSDFIGHECGVALLRLRQPLSYYLDRYGDPRWALRKLYLLMEKQHNRGQDGAGIATVKFDMPPGEKFMLRARSAKHNAIERLFDVAMKDARRLARDGWGAMNAGEIKQQCDFVGEVYLGHLRYGTHSKNRLANCHPLVRKNNTASRNLAIAGNFNMTNSAALFRQLVEYGLNPVGDSDTQVVLERLGYFLDREHEYLRTVMGPESFRGLDGIDLAREVSQELNIGRLIGKAAQAWDGAYLLAGLLGNGDAFACRDAAGIRPGYYYIDDEVVALASERAALSSVFDVQPERVESLDPGHALIIKADGAISHERVTEAREIRQCTFERIYFSRGNDPDIYCERKALGRLLAPRVMKAIDNDVEHAVFSFVPNTAEAAYLGLTEEVNHLSRAQLAETLGAKLDAGTATRDDLQSLLSRQVRAEKIAHKDQRMRTFITHDDARRDLVMHIYDITRGIVHPEDTLVVLDDSIVRGTTLRESIITILSRLNPRRILVASSAPPIMYPDCYGIDMSQLGRFIAFEAAICLLRDRGEEDLLDEVEERCEHQSTLPEAQMVNHVGMIYDRFTLDELSAKVAELVRPRSIDWAGEIQIIYQTVDGLRHAMPAHTGDWYFTGRYPTPGGFRVLNRSFLNWRRQVDVRAY